MNDLRQIIESVAGDGRTLGFWLAILGTSMLVVLRSEETSVLGRLMDGAASALLGMTLGPELAEFAGVSPTLSAVAVTMCGPAFLLAARKAVTTDAVVAAIRRVIGRP